MGQVIRVPIELEIDISVTAEQCSDNSRLIKLCEAMEAELNDSSVDHSSSISAEVFRRRCEDRDCSIKPPGL